MAQASFCFLSRADIYKKEKPYAIQYEPHGDVPQSNVIQEMVGGIPIRDIRPVKDKLTLEEDGLLIRNLYTDMQYDDFANPAAVQKTYLPKLHTLLKETLGTKNVALLEYLVRRRDPVFPLSPGIEFELAQPVPTAHIDFSPKGVRDIVEDRYGVERARELLKLHYKVVNVWKPLFGPLMDWPLAFCKPSSLRPDDIEVMDNVFPKNVEESIQLHYSDKEDWCFLDQQEETEVVIFQGGDSKLGLYGGVPHCSFKDARYGNNIRPRESIEVRALAFFTDEDLVLDNVVPSRRHGPKSTYAQDDSFRN